jgi:hypothetical protein
MAHTSIRQTIPLAADTVWSLVGDLRTGDQWPAVLRCEIEGEGIGCIRTLHLVDGNAIRERLEARDGDARLLRWEVLEFSKLPLRSLHYTLTVRELGPSDCTVDWYVDFETAGDSEEHVRKMLQGIYGSIRASILENLGVD